MDIHCFDKFADDVAKILSHDWICISVSNRRTFHNTKIRQSDYIAELRWFPESGDWEMKANPELFNGMFRTYPYVDGREVKFISCPEIPGCIEFLDLLLEKILNTPR